MYTIWLLCSVIFLLSITWMRWRHRNRRLLELANKIPGPKTIPILGNALSFMCKPEEMAYILKDLLDEYGSIFRFWLGPDLNIVLNDPDDLKIVLSSPKMSVKGPQYKYMADVLGGGILSGSGPIWRRHRKIATPNYGKKAIESYGEVFNREVDELMVKCRNVPKDQQFDIYKYVVQATSYAVCQTLMGLTKPQTMNLPHLQNIIDDTPIIYDIVFDRMTKWWYQIDPIFWLSGAFKMQETFKNNIEQFSKTVIGHRIEKLNTLGDELKRDLMNENVDCVTNTELSVIDRLILSNELDPEELIKETFTIFTSSQEASAKISSFLILMMAYHPNYQEILYQEIVNTVGLEDRHITDDDLKQMPYLDMVFKEILRLFPIGTMIQRTVTEELKISKGILIPGCSILAPIYHLHRDPQYWDKPNSFYPEHFAPETIKRRHPNCYIPFSLGPMDCVGRYFGIKLVKIICVRFLRDFHVIALNKYENMKINIAISASPIDGYNIIIRKR